jgi:hypothetical protein
MINNSITKNGSISSKITGVFALIIGIVSIFAGSKVLLEIDVKDYNVLVWLVQYNVVLGSISIIVAFLIFKKLEIAKISIFFVLFSHLSVLIYLKFFSTTVASESIKAMLFRVVIWFFILFIYILMPQFFIKKTAS